MADAAENGVPRAVRRLSTADSTQLAHLAEIFGDLQFVLRCCELLIGQLAGPPEASDDVAVEALWTAALVGYVRCFSGQRKGLRESDVPETGLSGQVEEFHKQLWRLRDHYASRHVNPRERITVAAAQGADGRASGVAITSAPRPRVDELTVRQTGQLALALSGLVEKRMEELQQRVFDSAKALSTGVLSALPVVELDQPEEPAAD